MKSAMESGLGIVFDCCSKEALLGCMWSGQKYLLSAVHRPGNMRGNMRRYVYT